MTALVFKARPKTSRIILHDSHLPPGLPHHERHLRVNGREMGLLEVGYHYVIEREGRVVRTRDHGVMGAHVPGHNHDSIGVCLAMAWEEGDELPPPEQLQPLGQLVGYLRSLYGAIPLLGHSEVQRYRNRKQDCPCHLDMDKLRATLGITIERDTE